MSEIVGLGETMSETQLAYPLCPLCSWPTTDCTCTEDESEAVDDERTHIGPWT